MSYWITSTYIHRKIMNISIYAVVQQKEVEIDSI